MKTLDNGAHVPQATRALWIADIARTLSGLNATVDGICYSAVPCRFNLGANRAWRMAEAVAYEHVVGIRLFLVDTLAHLILCERLLAFGAKVHDGAIGRSAKQVGFVRDVRQADGKHGLDCLAFYGFAFLSAGGASVSHWHGAISKFASRRASFGAATAIYLRHLTCPFVFQSTVWKQRTHRVATYDTR